MGCSSVFAFGSFCFDPAKRLLLRSGTAVSITPKAIDTLQILIENRHRVVSKGELLRKLWPDTAVEEASLSQQIFLLRKVLGDDSSSPQSIATISRRGFRFVAEVVEGAEPDSGAVEPRPEQSTLRPRGREWPRALRFRPGVLLLVAAAAVFFYTRFR